MGAAHTPGPWSWNENLVTIEADTHLTMRVLSPGILVLDAHSGCGGPWGDEHDQANARLIAAAPELLEALRSIAAKADQMAADREQHNRGLWAACGNEARAAIAKATGVAS